MVSKECEQPQTYIFLERINKTTLPHAQARSITTKVEILQSRVLGKANSRIFLYFFPKYF